MLNYFLGYAAFLLGVFLYLLGKIQDYKQMAASNSDQSVVFSLSKFWTNEWINITRLLVAGMAIVIFTPMITGGRTVTLNNDAGQAITSFALKAILAPMYFLLGYSGTSGVFRIFGKYKKTLLNKVGVEDDK